MFLKGTRLSKLKKRGNRYFYQGKWWTLNTPTKLTPKGKKMGVFASKKVFGHIRAKIIRFMPLSANYKHKGRLPKSNCWAEFYWARKVSPPKKRRKVAIRRKKKAVAKSRRAA